MSLPRFSIVIPTRDRPHTLRQALATTLDQDWDGTYEVIVCDNGSDDSTRAVVEAAASPRVRYLRTPRPLAMTDNWEMAVAGAEGEFVQVLGDDDALMPWALRELDGLLRRLGTPVVRWEAAFYTWPDIDLPRSADYLRLPLGRGLTWHEPEEVISGVVRFETPYSLLPTLYHATVRRVLLEDLRRRTGRILTTACPDIYSGFAVGHLAGRYPSVAVPMTMAGLSQRSTGVANIFRRHQSPVDADYRRLNAEAGLRHHPFVPDLPVFPEVFVADCFLQARALLFPHASSPALDRRRLLAHCVAASRPGDDAAEAALRSAAADDAELSAWLSTILAPGLVARRPQILLRPDRLGFDGESLHLDTALFGVSGLCDAVSLAERILPYRRNPIEYVATDSGERWTA